MVEYVRVRNITGIPSTDADGAPRSNRPRSADHGAAGGTAAVRGGGGQRTPALLIENKSVLPISREDYESSPVCRHGARFAADAFLGQVPVRGRTERLAVVTRAHARPVTIPDTCGWEAP